MLRWSLSVIATVVLFVCGMLTENFRHSCNCGGSGVLRLSPDPPESDEPPLAVDPTKPLKVIVTKYTADGRPYQEEIVVPPAESKDKPQAVPK